MASSAHRTRKDHRPLAPSKFTPRRHLHIEDYRSVAGVLSFVPSRLGGSGPTSPGALLPLATTPHASATSNEEC
jgi:hypothetical protein